VYYGERLIEKWRGLKCKHIFKYLVTHREQLTHREILMELFWRDAPPDAARRNLYQAIYHLRNTLRSGDPDFDPIVSENNGYSFNPDLEIWLDSEAFLTHYQAGLQLEGKGRTHEAVQEYAKADSLYAGEYMAEDRYEDWPLEHRENLKHEHLAILAKLSQYYFAQGQISACIAFCQKILAEDKCREDAHRRLMRCYIRQGQRHLALRQYQICVEALRQELDVPPMPATTELYQHIQQDDLNFQMDEN
jgi:DNA-binding SARP family transcriptional activator